MQLLCCMQYSTIVATTCLLPLCVASYTQQACLDVMPKFLTAQSVTAAVIDKANDARQVWHGA